jgi:Ca2+/H+ antiporter, TMEM165/GDT1 family
MDLKLFTSTFILILLAELPDKTAFAILIMATKSPPLGVFLGASGAFIIQSLVAVIFGGVVGLLPPRIVHVGSALLFFFFAWQLFREGQRKGEEGLQIEANTPTFKKTVVSSFLTIFIAEWGDLTQLATVTLVAKYKQSLTIFSAATLALMTVTAVGSYVGHKSKNLINPSLLRIFAIVAFIGVGIYFLKSAI